MKKAIILLSLIFLFPLVIIPLPAKGQTVERDISFEPNILPKTDVYYQNYDFVFQYKTRYIKIRPFVIYEGKYYGAKKIVQWIKNNYPNVNYKWLVDKAVHAVHYGYNLTNLPQNIADKIDYLGFRLVDYNFPLSWFELETKLTMIGENEYNITIIKIPRINLEFSFEDLYPYGYSIEHINSTYILIGNVKGITDLIVDPIVYSANIITVTGYTEGSPCGFDDVWIADKNGTFELMANQSAGNHVLTTQVRPAENRSIHLEIIASQVTVNGSCFINGTEKDNSIQTENITINANTTFTTSLYYNTVNYINCTGTWYIQINQSQWGVVIKEGDYQYLFLAQLRIGDGATTTWFADTQKQVAFDPLVPISWVIYPTKYSTFRLGELVDATDRASRYGCSLGSHQTTGNPYLIYQPYDNNIDVFLYSSHFYSTNRRADVACYERIWNCIFSGRSWVGQGGSADLWNVIITDATRGIYRVNPSFAENIFVSGAYYAIQFFAPGGSGVTLRNVVVRNSTYEIQANLINNDCFAIDFDLENWSIHLPITGTENLYRQYTFNLKVTYNGFPVENANVTVQHFGVNAGQDFVNQTDSNGDIQEQILNMGFYNATGGDTLYDYNPFQLIIEADGFSTFVQDFTLDDKTEWVVELQPYDRLGGILWLLLFLIAGATAFVTLTVGLVKFKR